MPAENEKQNIENENYETSSELLDLKKKLADEVVDKLLEKDPGLFSYIFKKGLISDYLVDEKNIEDTLHDEVLIGGIGKSIISPEIKKYREMINQARTKDDLENLRTKIFNEISGNNQSSSDTSEQTNSPTPTASTTSRRPTTPTTQATPDSPDSSSTTEKAEVDTSSQSYEIDHFNIRVSPETKKIWDNLKGKKKPDLEPFACAMKAYKTEKSKGNIKNDKYITVIDFTKNQKKSKRCFVINIQTNTVEHAEKCGHGSGSGNAEWATSFGNVSGSHKSSLGAYITADHSRSNTKGTWHSNFGKGIEKSNNKSKDRGIALLHPVKSLTYASGKPTSDGCITIPGSQKKVDKILNKIEGGSLVFAYAKSENYFAQSQFFQKNPDGSYTA